MLKTMMIKLLLNSLLEKGSIEIVKTLIEKKANLNAKNHKGSTLLGIAKEKDSTELIKAFETYREPFEEKESEK